MKGPYRIGLTALISMVGVGACWLLSLPLPFLFGPLAACIAAALVGAPLKDIGALPRLARVMLGLAIGTSVTAELLLRIPSMWASVLLVALHVAVIGVVGVPFFRRLLRFDPVTAFYAAMPGGASDMMLFGQEAGGNVRQLALVHVTRLAAILMLAPVILVQVYEVSLSHPVGRSAADVPGLGLFLTMVLGILGWTVADRIGMFGAAVLGPMIISAVASVAGLEVVRPPAEFLLAAQFVIGMSIGCAYVGITFAELTGAVAGAAAYVVVLALLTAIVTEFAVLIGAVPPVEGFLSFMPGGQAEMTMLAIVTGSDLGFVAVHHVSRILLVILGAPLIFRLTAGVGGKKD